MTSLKEFFNQQYNDISRGISHKNNIIKRSIIAYMIMNGETTISDLAKFIHISVPTITKLINELVEGGIVTDNGKIETIGGRRPNVFGIANSTIYFAGIEVGRDFIICVVTDLKNNVVYTTVYKDFILDDSAESLENICTTIDGFLDNCGIDRDKIIGLGVSIAGRVNPITGRSHKYFIENETPLKDTIQQRVNIQVLLENDTRARCYAEYFTGSVTDEKSVIYLHLGRGVAIGIIIDGKLFYGKSGFAGEFGHIPYFDNDIICACGKKGCLETEISGIAIENQMIELINSGVNTILRDKYRSTGTIHIDDIVCAAKNDDNLSIELIEKAGAKVGKSLSFLINVFNPEVVIIGGNIAQAGDYIMLPIKFTANKHSLNLVYKDTIFKLSEMKDNSGALGAAMLIRNTIIEF